MSRMKYLFMSRGNKEPLSNNKITRDLILIRFSEEFLNGIRQVIHQNTWHRLMFVLDDCEINRLDLEMPRELFEAFLESLCSEFRSEISHIYASQCCRDINISRLAGR